MEIDVGFSNYMGFRISFGQAKCDVDDDMASPERKVCEHLLFKLDSLKELSFQQLSSFREEEIEVREIDGKLTKFSTYKEVLTEDKVLVVVQAFYPTWRFPNFFTLNAVGKIFAEALVISRSGSFEAPSDDLLYKYR
jgi:hypothetical protein